MPLTAIPDQRRRDEVMTQYGELRRHLFDQHLKTLDPDQRLLLECGKHPSQDHGKAKEALQYAETLRERLKHHQFVKKVGVGSYHCNRNVLDVFVSGIELLDPQLQEIPDFFEGFEVLVLKSKNVQNETHPDH